MWINGLTDGWADIHKQTDMTKLEVASRIFANASESDKNSG